MNSRPDPGLDEPTVIARRPLGPNRGAGARKPSGPGAGAAGQGAWRAIEPPSRDPAFDDMVARLPEAKGGQSSHGVPVPEEPKRDEDKLCAAATPLLVLVAHLKGAVEQADVEALRKEIADQLRRFEERAVRFGASGNDVSAARYALCSLIDETVMTTPWGSSSSWSTNSLLLEFHSETWGGEKFFAILDRTKSDPARHLALFKLLDLCLLLGFEGKYRVIDNGRDQLNDLRLELGRILRQFGKTPSEELSPSWRGTAQRRSLQRFVPLWVVFSVTAVILVSSYGLIKWRIWSETMPALHALGEVAKTN